MYCSFLKTDTYINILLQFKCVVIGSQDEVLRKFKQEKKRILRKLVFHQNIYQERGNKWKILRIQRKVNITKNSDGQQMFNIMLNDKLNASNFSKCEKCHHQKETVTFRHCSILKYDVGTKSDEIKKMVTSKQTLLSVQLFN